MLVEKAQHSSEVTLALAVAQSKEKLLTDLRKELQISNDEHYKVLSGVMADEEVTAIRTGAALPAPPPPLAAAAPQGAGGGMPAPKRRKDGEERVPLGARCAPHGNCGSAIVALLGLTTGANIAWRKGCLLFCATQRCWALP